MGSSNTWDSTRAIYADDEATRIDSAVNAIYDGEASTIVIYDADSSMIEIYGAATPIYGGNTNDGGANTNDGGASMSGGAGTAIVDNLGTFPGTPRRRRVSSSSRKFAS